jgi:hypothetical protein
MSYNSNEIRYSDKLTYTVDRNNICIIKLPSVLSENIKENYHVNISKLSFGDYMIKEKTKEYFVLESDINNFSFTFECIFDKLEKNNYRNIPNNLGIKEESYEVETFSISNFEEIRAMYKN